MKTLPVFLGLIIFFGLAGMATADIYTWTDADGVRHFSNHTPPNQAEAVVLFEEVPYVEPTAQELREAQQAERLAEAQQEIGELEAERMERQREAEREIEAARQKADRALQEAEERLTEARKKSDSSRTTGIYSIYYPIRRHFAPHGKLRIHSPLRSWPDFHKKRFENRKDFSIRKPFDRHGRGRLEQPWRDRVRRPGGFSADRHPGILLRIR